MSSKISAVRDWLWEHEKRHRARPLWHRILANIGAYLFWMLVLFFHDHVWAYAPRAPRPLCPPPRPYR